MGLVSFVLAFVVAAAVTPGSNPIQEYISALAARTSPHPWIMTIGFGCLAASTVAAGFAVKSRLPSASGTIGSVLLALAGLGLVGSAVFRLDCSTTIEACAAREVAGTVSGAHVLHNLASLLSHLLLVAAYLVLSRALRRSAGLARLSVSTLIVGLATMAFIVGVIVTDFGQVGGIVQRVAVVVAYGWSVWLAAAPLPQASAKRASAAQSVPPSRHERSLR